MNYVYLCWILVQYFIYIFIPLYFHQSKLQFKFDSIVFVNKNQAIKVIGGNFIAQLRFCRSLKIQCFKKRLGLNIMFSIFVYKWCINQENVQVIHGFFGETFNYFCFILSYSVTNTLKKVSLLYIFIEQPWHKLILSFNFIK